MGAVLAFLRRDFEVARSYRLPFVFDTVSALFMLASFRFVGRLVSSKDLPVAYFAFVACGLALMAVVQTALTVIGGNLRQEQVSGTLEAMVATGVATPALAAGLAAYPVASSLVRAAVYVLLAAGMGARFPGANVPLATAGAALAALSFAGIGILAAAFVLVFRQALALTGWVVSLLALAGGAYFPTSLLPGWARALGGLSPFTRGLQVFRDALLHGAGWGTQAWALLALAGMGATYAALGAGGLALALRRVVRTGGLAQY